MSTSIFEQIGDSSKNVYFVFDLNTRGFTYLNNSVEQVLEGDRQRFLDDPGALLGVVHPEDRLLVTNHFNSLLRGKQIKIEFRLQMSQVSSKVVQAEAFPVYNEEGALVSVAGTAEDITERVEYLAYLMEFGRKKNSGLEILAHDLRGPIAMVQGLTYTMEADIKEQDLSEIAKYTQLIYKACEKSINLITDILSEEHLKSPTIVVKKERVNLVDKVKEVVELYAMNKSITQSFTIVAPPVAYSNVDIVKIDQIINNLVSNSIKFTAPDGAITLTIEKEESNVLLKFSDNGVGIPQEILPFIFDKYTRAARQGLHGEKTRGIGLSIVKELVGLQGGEIWCESEENKGSTFYLRLPSAD